MMKFIKQHMSTIEGIDIYPIISLLIFFFFFLALGLYVFGSPKKKFEEASRIPLDDDQIDGL